MAFHLRFFHSVGTWRDEDGHALHEVDFREELEPGDYRVCPYPDSRRGRTINRRALAEVSRSWSDIRSDARALGELDGSAFESEQSRCWQRALRPMFYPVFLRLVLGEYPIPRYASTLFKVMLDVPTTLDLQLAARHSHASVIEKRLTSPEMAAEFAESAGILVNGDFACAGTPKMLSESVLWFIDDTGHGIGPTTQSSRAKSVQEPSFTRFAQLMGVQYAAAAIYQLHLAALMEVGFGSLPVESRDSPAREHVAADRLSAYERRRRISLYLSAEPSDRVSITRAFHLASCDGGLREAEQELVLALARLVEIGEKVAIEVLPHDKPSNVLAAHGVLFSHMQSVVLACQRRMRALFSLPERLPTEVFHFADAAWMPHVILAKYC